MNPEQARQILLLHRPGDANAEPPELAEALALAQRDPALRDWFAAHCATQEKIRAGFQTVAVPEGLREQILSERPTRALRWRPVLATALAGLVVLAALVVMAQWLRQRDATSYAAYQHKMVAVASYGYAMSLATNDLQAIRRHLAEAQAPADFELPPRLEKLEALGCMTTLWAGRPVTLLCLRTAANPAGPGEDLWLFVTDQSAARGAPELTTPKYQQVDDMDTARWAAKGRTYLLVTRGGAAVIKEVLGGHIN